MSFNFLDDAVVVAADEGARWARTEIRILFAEILGNWRFQEPGRQIFKIFKILNLSRRGPFLSRHQLPLLALPSKGRGGACSFSLSHALRGRPRPSERGAPLPSPLLSPASFLPAAAALSFVARPAPAFQRSGGGSVVLCASLLPRRPRGDHPARRCGVMVVVVARLPLCCGGRGLSWGGAKFSRFLACSACEFA